MTLKSFMACIEDDLREREAKDFGKGLDTKVKLDLLWYIVCVVVPVMLSHIRHVTSLFLVHLRSIRISCQD